MKIRTSPIYHGIPLMIDVKQNSVGFVDVVVLKYKQ